MSEKACRGPRALLMDYALGELDPLKMQRVETHVQRCEECSSLLARYRTAFDSARSWEPRIDDSEIDQMVDRLTPYMEAGRPRRVPYYVGAGIGALAAAAAAVFFTTRTDSIGSPSPAAAPIAATRTMTIPEPESEPEPTVEPVVRQRPTRHLRVVASKTWNGAIQKKSKKLTKVKMTKGFAVMSFEGGRGRKLEIEAPDVTIEVIGTRFYVEAKPGEPTVVGVVSGKVRVRSKKGDEQILEAGKASAFDASGAKPVDSVRSTAHHADDFLEYEPTKPKPPKRRAVAPKPPPPKKADPMDVLLEAERLVREGENAAAAAAYTKAIESGAGSMAPLMRYERARLWAFKMKRPNAARAELAKLAKTKGEVAVQAALTLCEMQRSREPCRAKECLDDLAKSGVGEAEKTIERWHLDRFECR